jgi:hypothetical protein
MNPEKTMTARIFPACLSALLLLSGCTAHRVAVAAAPSSAAAPSPPGATAAAVVVADTVREALPNDYMRVGILPASVKVTTLSKPGSLRAFVTATQLYSPPLRVADYPYYSGLAYSDQNMLVAMRCRPPHPETVDVVLATWPNVFAVVQKDVALAPGDCDAAPADPGKQVACYAKGFTDPPSTTVPASLSHTFSYAGVLYDRNHTALAQWLKDNYGIFPAFAGTGYSVKDSYSIDKQPMTSQQILVKSVSSEYLLKNVSLADAGCRCISVAPANRHPGDPLDPDFIEQNGGRGVCIEVKRLGEGKH